MGGGAKKERKKEEWSDGDWVNEWEGGRKVGGYVVLEGGGTGLEEGDSRTRV